MGGYRQYGKTVWPGFTEVETRHVAKVGRNDPCPCGKGRKYKDCHESAGTAWLEKLAREQDRARVKSAGAPWWRRILGG